jgi:hypothetical protein
VRRFVPVLSSVFLIALLGSTTATAEPDPLAGWVTDGRYPIAQRLLNEHRLIPIAEPDVEWTTEELIALERGAAALPRAIVDELDEPIEIRRVHHACLFGVGRFTEGCPTFDRKGRFLLYDVPPLQGEGPVRRLAPLDEQERFEIQRRRAAVHAIMLAFDDEMEWSDSDRWRAINGWRNRRQPFNRDVWGYSRYLGNRSPRLDLVTFAEEWFIRPADVIAEERRGELDPDLSLECQTFTRDRFFSERVAILDPTWHPPDRDRRPPDRQCPAFESWAQLNHVEAIDILVAAATADRPESLYGHLLVHIRYDDRSEGFEPVYQFGAVTDTNVAPLTYFSRGLLGGFLSVIQLNSFRSVDRLFLQYEQRGLRRYVLDLSPKQTRRLMERIWEYERRFRYPYHFFANNCASFLIDLIGPALELDVPDRGRLIVAPTDVLDYLANVENPGRGALLKKRPEMSFSSREVAQKAVNQRREALDALVDSLPAKNAVAERLREYDRVLDTRDPERRSAAYASLQKTLVDVLKGAPKDTVQTAIDYLYYSSRIERYFAEVAFYRVREIKQAAVEEPVNHTAEELLERRRELYEHEDALARFEKLLEWTETAEKRVLDGPYRPFTKKEKAELHRADLTQAAYMAALDAQATVIETHAPDFDGVQYLEAKRERFVAEQKRRDRLATGPSGKGRIEIGGGASAAGLQGPVGSVFGSYSFILERLGEQRRRGFRSDIESQALGFELHVPTVDRFWENVDLDATVFRFLTIEQKLGPVRRGFFDIFGWGADVHLDHDGRRGLDFGGGVSGGLLYPIWQHDHAANHLVVGTWLDVRADLGDQGRLILGGGDAFARLLLHLGGVYANSLRMEVGTRHWFGLESLSWEYEHRARLATEHALFWVGQHPLILSPWVQGQYTTLDYQEDDREFIDVRGGLSVELPL